MSLPTGPASDELRALRARAYGPDADIELDPAAMARLYELENSTRERLAPIADSGTVVPDVSERVETGAAPITVAAAVAASGPPAPADADASRLPGPFSSDAPGRSEPVTGEPAADAASASPEQATGDAPAPAPVPWWRRRMRLLWAGSVVVAALLGAALALSVHAFGAGQVAVLHPDPDAEWPEGLFEPPPEGASAYEDFYGVTALVLPQQVISGAGSALSDCLYLATSGSSSYGFYGGGCGAGAFPATASVVITEDAPDDLIERFGTGTALQFVLDGSQIRVYAAAPAPGATP